MNKYFKQAMEHFAYQMAETASIIPFKPEFNAVGGTAEYNVINSYTGESIGTLSKAKVVEYASSLEKEANQWKVPFAALKPSYHSFSTSAPTKRTFYRHVPKPAESIADFYTLSVPTPCKAREAMIAKWEAENAQVAKVEPPPAPEPEYWYKTPASPTISTNIEDFWKSPTYVVHKSVWEEYQKILEPVKPASVGDKLKHIEDKLKHSTDI